jgi:hypothetical protein
MLGIGLGAFVSGMERGMQMRQKIDATRAAKKQNDALKQIAEDAKAKYGDVMSDEAYNYMLQRQEMLYRQSGDVEKAGQFRKWGQEETARKGTKLFGGILSALKVGDLDNAVGLANDLSNLDGYGPIDDYQFGVADHPQHGRGIVVAGKDGKPLTFVMPDQAPQVFAQFANPEKAFEWSSAQAKEQKASAKELEKEAQKIRSGAIDTLRKQMDGGLAGDEPKFDDLPEDEQEKLIRKNAWQEITPGRRKQFEPYFGADGQPGISGGQQAAGAGKKAPGLMIVDDNTGEPIAAASKNAAPTPAAAPSESRMPVSSAEKVERRPLPGLGGRGEAPIASPDQISPSGIAAGTSTPRRGRRAADVIAEADEAIQRDRSPDRAIEILHGAGIPQDQWPERVKAAVGGQRRPAMGLNP